MGEIFAIFAIWEWKTLKTTTYFSYQLRLLKLWYNNCGVRYILAVKLNYCSKKPSKTTVYRHSDSQEHYEPDFCSFCNLGMKSVAAKTSNAIGVQNRKEKANNHSTKSEMGQILQCHQNSNPAMALEEKFADLRLWSRSGFASCCMIFESDKTFVTLSLQSQPCFRSFIISVFYGGVPTSGSL